MKFLCLMPVWNHRTDTIQNAVQCFLDRTYPEADLLIIDDRPRDSQFTRNEAPGDRVLYWRAAGRFDSLPAKYNAALWQYENFYKRDYDTISIWDDDDGFLPKHLEYAADGYASDQNIKWTYPELVYTTYGGILKQEEPNGRFWSSITFLKECLPDGRFPVTKAVGHDQYFLQHLAKNHGKPYQQKKPTYIYRWGNEGENHSSGVSTGINCERWWEATPSSHSGCILYPDYDEFYLQTLFDLKNNFDGAFL